MDFKDCLRGVFFKNYNGFTDKTKFYFAENITLLIGKNNTGKSSVLDIIGYALDGKGYRERLNPGNVTAVCEKIQSYFTKENPLSMQEDTRFWTQHDLLQRQGKYYPFVVIDNEKLDDDELLHEGKYVSILQTSNTSSRYKADLQEYKVLRINAERNIVAEPETDVDNFRISIREDGSGATNLIRAFIYDSDKDEDVIEKQMLTALNDIMQPEAYYESIKIQKDSKNKKWEVYLTEVGGRRVPLSKTGSGLKTVILVLINMLVLTQKRYPGEKMVYLFEELENNLHPALQRRLFDYIYDNVKDKEDRIVLTSHSPIAINSLYGRKGVGLYHVIKNEHSELEQVLEYNGKRSLLDDLDVKASDILQSNGLIWVEGPSDRVYIKHWIDILSDCRFKEGVDYQFLYYGGKNLSHYTAETNESSELSDLINILKVNRNAVVVMDSDKNCDSEDIRSTKQRVLEELESNGQVVWITEGREIENYLPADAINRRFQGKQKQIEKYKSFKDYIKSKDKNFISHKVEFANEIVKYIDKRNMDILDLNERITMLISQIERWNK